jgi:HEAT repeat protein
MPADKQAAYDELIAGLTSTGEEGVIYLVNTINAPGKGTNAPTDYALSGLAHYVSDKGQENARLIVAGAYVKALDIATERETKAFIIRELQICGRDECVDALGQYLAIEDLSGPAARALANINTEKAKQALQAALLRRMGTPKTQQDVILAVGEAKIKINEELISGMIGKGSEEMQKLVLYAISRIGTEKSLEIVRNAAAAAGYKTDKTGANEAYIALIKKIAAEGNAKVAEKAAGDLLDAAMKAGQTQTRIAALEILFSQSSDPTKLLLSSLKDQSGEYRNSALNFASAYSNREMYAGVLKSLPKAKNEVKTDILNWIGRESKINKPDLPYKKNITDQLKDPDLEVRQAAASALMKIGDISTIPALAELLENNDPPVVKAGQNALESFDGDIIPSLVKTIPASADAGKVAALQLLALRKADKAFDTVLEQVKSGSPEVKKAAYATLKDVVVEKDFPLLCSMLESAEEDAIAPLQQAIIASIASQSAADRFAGVSKKMSQVEENKKYLYYIVLSATGDKQALPVIVSGFKNENGIAKDAAFDAIYNWKGIEAANELYAVCTDISGAAYFDRALTAYVRLVSLPALTPENRFISLRKAMEIAKTEDQKNNILRRIGQTETFPAMIYAGDFLDNKPVQQTAANAVMNISANHSEYTGQIVRDLLEKVIQVLDNPDAGYQREAIRKQLNEMPEEEPFKLSDEEEKEGFKVLFDGTNMHEWVGNTVDYTLKRGHISLIPSSSFGGNLYTKSEYGNFVFRFEFQLTPAANNGLGIRTPMEGDAAYVGMELQIIDNEDPVYKNLQKYQYHGSVYGVIPAKRGFLKPLGEWNYQEVIADGDHIKITLNGEVILDGNIREASKNGTIDGKQHPGLLNKTGHIGFLGHGSPVKFRNIRIKELK